MALTLDLSFLRGRTQEDLPRTGNPLVDACTREQCITRLRELRDQRDAGFKLSSRDVQLVKQFRRRACL